MEIAKKDLRIIALQRFAIAITVLTIAGHLFLGFEQSFIQPIAALITTYSLELIIEFIQSKLSKRKPKYSGGIKNLINFLLPAHITALAVALLIYSNERVGPIIFAAAVAILSKVIFQVSIKEVQKHFFNPSNFGITVALLLFPWVGIAPPYHFTENVSGALDWIIPAIIITSGSFLNIKLTKKLPLILGWLTAFALQAILRHVIFDTSLISALSPMTGLAFLLYTFYMITDPATTPIKKSHQLAFGVSVAFVYGMLMSLHIVFGLFFSLTLVCLIRGTYLFAADLSKKFIKDKILFAPSLIPAKEKIVSDEIANTKA